ncbi:hypothetical protein [Arthrobacter sp. ISL-30]|uniref:hypothetical protein n=1 Tax=Arthrobacter sp. ISL-30 TaxID=2819109 RepID=UPI001BE58DF9|nr:hypothetical protein [Arthrobacter sp. ISL-30]MBT2512205.1 hypothetical protein [Arthrobacter sp. ISL-30]
MTATSSEGTVIRVSTAGAEPIVLQLEGGEAVTLRVEVENNCVCQAATATRPGSYTDRDVLPSA